ncbi:MAG: hypothetical protein CMG11_06105 [Candidatus Marinimicrobia bacterium]|nr:hypothetical protein [Candidatus Neomarinimicrobiota bacterium]|tara:strand:- start:213 stop:1046 length:834 start_codon:yes stop_codon:yes gene_type:complete
MIFKFLPLLLLLLFLSCDAQLDNPLDPEGDDFVEPETTITNDNLDGSVINTSSLTINWEGNDLATDYSVNLKNHLGWTGWSEWSSQTDTTYHYLNEGSFYEFQVKCRYANGIEDETPAIAQFTVDAVESPGIRFYPLYTDINFNSEVSIYIEGIDNISFGSVVFDVISENETSCNEIEISSIENAEGVDPLVFIVDSDSSVEPGVLATYTVNFGEDGDSGINNNYFDLAKITFSQTTQGTQCGKQIELRMNLEETELRDYNNNLIDIIDKADGVVGQ